VGSILNRTLALIVGLLIVLGTAAYAQSLRFATSSQGARILAGEVSAGGSILKGSGFSVSRLRTGLYAVRFGQESLMGTCPVMTVSIVANQASPPTAQVNQKLTSCGRSIDVVFYDPASGQPIDEAFNFIAGGT
jgi:hypothetical protein